jgi:hypothetical protein
MQGPAPSPYCSMSARSTSGSEAARLRLPRASTRVTPAPAVPAIVSAARVVTSSTVVSIVSAESRTAPICANNPAAHRVARPAVRWCGRRINHRRPSRRAGRGRARRSAHAALRGRWRATSPRRGGSPCPAPDGRGLVASGRRKHRRAAATTRRSRSCRPRDWWRPEERLGRPGAASPLRGRDGLGASLPPELARALPADLAELAGEVEGVAVADGGGDLGDAVLGGDQQLA